MKFLNKSFVPVAIVLAATAPGLASCSDDQEEVVNNGTEITFNTEVSRATQITTADGLKGFYVWADAVGYGQMFMEKVEATRKENTSTYTLPTNYYWPSDVQRMRFWAYGPSGTHADGGLDVKGSITVDRQEFEDLVPKKSLTDGGKDQRDMLVAYTEVTKTGATGMSVPVTFLHALSQIEVKAILGEESNKKVRIKGCWIMNVSSSGNLSFKKPTDDPTGNLFQATADNMNWVASTVNYDSYGIEIASPQPLTHSESTYLIGGGDNSSLMLIPQTTGALEFDAAGASKKGAYILLLCRIDIEHNGTSHEGSDEAIGVVGDKHYHQLFPQSTAYNAAEYGYTCVPLDIDWKPGTKYVYTLNFCGPTSGAGVYPPQPSDEFPTNDVVDRPDDKKEGDHVLDNPITFSVEFAPWTEAKETPDM